jgi:hypothetical protein
MRYPTGWISGLLLAGWLPSMAAEIRIGLIGLDTSHAPAFADLHNEPKAKDHVAGARVVAAVPGGSADVESSWKRVPEYTETLVKKHNIRIHGTIEAMLKEVDAVMLLSVDGRPHLAQARPVIAARKPLFIDKPLAGSLRDGAEIFRLAQEAHVPVFTSSSLRFAKGTLAVHQGAIGTVTNAVTGSPAHLEPHHPDLFWYGIHGVESLFTVMGTGCESVRRTRTANGEIEVVGTWRGGRTGTFREDKGYTGQAQGDKGSAAVGTYDGYAPLVVEVVKFFETGQPPVPAAESLEILAFMEAADESKKRDGAAVSLGDIRRSAGLTP